MKPRFFAIIEHCVENGAKRGYHRAHKHVDDPTPEAIADHVTQCVMSELCEWFDFNDTP